MLPRLIKALILPIYNFILPKESRVRDKYYAKFLWLIFPDQIDKFLFEVAKKQQIKFIEIGANDGISWDPLYKFIKKFHWEGILIEPHPAYFKELMASYKNFNQKKLHFENIAISSKVEVKNLYYIEESKSFSKKNHTIKGINSFDKSLVEKLTRNISCPKILTIKVPCNPLEDIIRKYEYWDFNLLMIDTEGFDFEIIQSINFEKIQPKMIYYEHVHLNQKQRESLDNIFSNNGYAQLIDGINTLAYR